MNSIVTVSKGEDPYHTAKEALRASSMPNVKGERVLIKPNAARLARPGQGITTHPLVVKAIINHLREMGAREMAIGESCIFGVNAQEAFRQTGIKEIAEEAGVELIDLDQHDPVLVPLPRGTLLKSIKVSAVLRQFGFIISVPVMKTHMHTVVTLSIKNMKGLLWRREKARLHQLRRDPKVMQGWKELDMAISDMATVLFPHLAVIDGMVGMEGMGPAYGVKRAAGVIVVGADALSADAVASRIMGFEPESIPHLKLSALKRLGEIETEKVLVEPRDYLKWKTPFEPPPTKFSIPFRDLLVHDEGSCSACLSTLIVFLQNYYPQLERFRLQDGYIHIGIGKNLEVSPEGTILIGNCTAKLRKRGIFIQGCPPVASEILRILSKDRAVKKKIKIHAKKTKE